MNKGEIQKIEVLKINNGWLVSVFPFEEDGWGVFFSSIVEVTIEVGKILRSKDILDTKFGFVKDK